MPSIEKTAACPFLGYGLRLQREFCRTLGDKSPSVDWFEIISETYLEAEEQEINTLERLRELYPLVMHGTTLAIGGTEPLNLDYLERIKSLAARLRPAWISDHLCGGDRTAASTQKLEPLPPSEEMLSHVVTRIIQVQEILQRPLLLENIPSLEPPSGMDEWDFIAQVAERSDSLILLDFDNIYFSAVNLGLDPMECLHRLPADRICQIHLGSRPEAGESELAIETPTENPVWKLYAAATAAFGPVSTMIEPTNTLPTLDRLIEELDQLRALIEGPLST